jgi:hypothetical protein
MAIVHDPKLSSPKFWSKINRFARGKVACKADAPDLVHTSYELAVKRALGRVTPRDVYMAFTKVLRKYRGELKKRPEALPDQVKGRNLYRYGFVEYVDHEVRTALDALPAMDRTLVEFRAQAKRGLRVFALSHGMEPGAVRARSSRVSRKLREKLGPIFYLLGLLVAVRWMYHILSARPWMATPMRHGVDRGVEADQVCGPASRYSSTTRQCEEIEVDLGATRSQPAEACEEPDDAPTDERSAPSDERSRPPIGDEPTIELAEPAALGRDDAEFVEPMASFLPWTEVRASAPASEQSEARSWSEGPSAGPATRVSVENPGSSTTIPTPPRLPSPIPRPEPHPFSPRLPNPARPDLPVPQVGAPPRERPGLPFPGLEHQDTGDSGGGVRPALPFAIRPLVVAFDAADRPDLTVTSAIRTALDACSVGASDACAELLADAYAHAHELCDHPNDEIVAWAHWVAAQLAIASSMATNDPELVGRWAEDAQAHCESTADPRMCLESWKLVESGE